MTRAHYATAIVGTAGTDRRDWLSYHCSCGYVTTPTVHTYVARRLIDRHVKAGG